MASRSRKIISMVQIQQSSIKIDKPSVIDRNKKCNFAKEGEIISTDGIQVDSVLQNTVTEYVVMKNNESVITTVESKECNCSNDRTIPSLDAVDFDKLQVENTVSNKRDGSRL
ncbi:unnamed protein product [Arctia plantaginis]|uniref:Uncharacterized protein n=1 Tax=Arctia plantaginis TaxID=874455 RepID=A0A8S1A8E9_ARCPL|nr:unnamed protein product [Arctia plantaginis]